LDSAHRATPALSPCRAETLTEDSSGISPQPRAT